MEDVIDFLCDHPGLCVDVTGGCPEMNPDFRFFISSAVSLASTLMVRTNLTVFFEPGLSWVPKWYSDNKVVVIASLPCYTDENVDRQRGEGVFSKSIEAIRILNDLGYGIDEQLPLNLVYSPGDDALPGPQAQLEADYKKELGERYAIKFNNLFTMANAPVGRFRLYLEANGKLRQYRRLLMGNFNPQAAESIMCRKLISIDYRGLAYNCDFNQALDLPITDIAEEVVSIERLGNFLKSNIEIITGEHCYCCTAGAGSSCTGSLVK